MSGYFWIADLNEIKDNFPVSGDSRAIDYMINLPCLSIDDRLHNQKFQLAASIFLDGLFQFNDFENEERKILYSLWGSLFWDTYGDADLLYFKPISNFLNYPGIHSWNSNMISEILELNKRVDFIEIKNKCTNIPTDYLFDKISNFDSFIDYHKLWIEILEMCLKQEKVLFYHIE